MSGMYGQFILNNNIQSTNNILKDCILQHLETVISHSDNNKMPLLCKVG